MTVTPTAPATDRDDTADADGEAAAEAEASTGEAAAVVEEDGTTCLPPESPSRCAGNSSSIDQYDDDDDFLSRSYYHDPNHDSPSYSSTTVSIMSPEAASSVASASALLCSPPGVGVLVAPAVVPLPLPLPLTTTGSVAVGVYHNNNSHNISHNNHSSHSSHSSHISHDDDKNDDVPPTVPRRMLSPTMKKSTTVTAVRAAANTTTSSSSSSAIRQQQDQDQQQGRRVVDVRLPSAPFFGTLPTTTKATTTTTTAKTKTKTEDHPSSVRTETETPTEGTKKKKEEELSSSTTTAGTTESRTTTDEQEWGGAGGGGGGGGAVAATAAAASQLLPPPPLSLSSPVPAATAPPPPPLPPPPMKSTIVDDGGGRGRVGRFGGGGQGRGQGQGGGGRRVGRRVPPPLQLGITRQVSATDSSIASTPSMFDNSMTNMNMDMNMMVDVVEGIGLLDDSNSERMEDEDQDQDQDQEYCHDYDYDLAPKLPTRQSSSRTNKDNMNEMFNVNVNVRHTTSRIRSSSIKYHDAAATTNAAPGATTIIDDDGKDVGFGEEDNDNIVVIDTAPKLPTRRNSLERQKEQKERQEQQQQQQQLLLLREQQQQEQEQGGGPKTNNNCNCMIIVNNENENDAAPRVPRRRQSPTPVTMDYVDDDCDHDDDEHMIITEGMERPAISTTYSSRDNTAQPPSLDLAPKVPTRRLMSPPPSPKDEEEDGEGDNVSEGSSEEGGGDHDDDDDDDDTNDSSDGESCVVSADDEGTEEDSDYQQEAFTATAIGKPISATNVQTFLRKLEERMDQRELRETAGAEGAAAIEAVATDDEFDEAQFHIEQQHGLQQDLEKLLMNGSHNSSGVFDSSWFFNGPIPVADGNAGGGNTGLNGQSKSDMNGTSTSNNNSSRSGRMSSASSSLSSLASSPLPPQPNPAAATSLSSPYGTYQQKSASTFSPPSSSASPTSDTGSNNNNSTSGGGGLRRKESINSSSGSSVVSLTYSVDTKRSAIGLDNGSVFGGISLGGGTSVDEGDSISRVSSTLINYQRIQRQKQQQDHNNEKPPMVPSTTTSIGRNDGDAEDDSAFPDLGRKLSLAGAVADGETRNDKLHIVDEVVGDDDDDGSDSSSNDEYVSRLDFGRYAIVEEREVIVDRIVELYKNVCGPYSTLISTGKATALHQPQRETSTHGTLGTDATASSSTSDSCFGRDRSTPIKRSTTSPPGTAAIIASPDIVGQAAPPICRTVMIHGLSGTGKSALVSHFMDKVSGEQTVTQQSLEKSNETMDANNSTTMKHTEVDRPQQLVKPIFLSGKYNEEYNQSVNGGNVSLSNGSKGTSATRPSTYQPAKGDGDGKVDSCPLSAISDAFSGLASIFKDEPETEEIIRRRVKNALGAQEIKFLISIIPALRTFLLDDSEITGDDSGEEIAMYVENNENALNQVDYIFASFCKAITSPERPVVLFLDDLQWCDSLSLRILTSLISDSQVKYLFTIGSYRSDEVSQTGFEQALSDLSSITAIEYVEVRNLSLTELASFIASVLQVKADEERTIVLAETIYGKTAGNIFFSKQILDQLSREGLLKFSRRSQQWEWRLDGVDLNDLLSDNVIQAVVSKLRSAPPVLQQALTIAAYTRSKIDVNLLFTLLRRLETVVPDMVHYAATVPSSALELSSALDSAVLDGLMTNLFGSTKYSFAHDRIQQAAYSLIPQGDKRDLLRLELGRILLEMAKERNEEGSDWMLFTAADHLNSASHLFRKQHNDSSLILLNLRVGKLAASKVAYNTAAKHLTFALNDLKRISAPNSPWEYDYSLTLDAYTLLADVLLRQGSFKEGFEIGSKVIDNSRCLGDRLSTQLEMTKAYGRQEDHKEAIAMSTLALTELGEFPTNSVSYHTRLVQNLVRVRSFFRSKTDDEILSMPPITDPKKIMVLDLLMCNAYQNYYMGNEIGYLNAILMMLVTTFKYGICGLSATALSGYGLVCNNLNDMEGAYRFCDLARLTLEQVQRKDMECLQFFVAAHWIHGWREPHEKVLQTYERAYRSGMECGDFENGLLSKTALYNHEYTCGANLVTLNEKFNDLVDTLEKKKVRSILVMTVEQHRKVQHLTGVVTPPLDKAELSKFGPVKNDNSETYHLLYGYLTRLELSVYFGDYDFARKMAKKLIPLSQFDKSYTTNSLRLFFASIAYAILARKCPPGRQRRSYLSKANTRYKELCRLCEIKGMNSIHRCLIMKAVLKTAGKTRHSDDSRIESSFDRAIRAALNSDHIQDAALACQLAAEYFSEDLVESTTNSKKKSKKKKKMNIFTHHNEQQLRQNRLVLVARHLNRARELYSQWGATAVVGHLELEYKNLFTTPTSSSTTTATALALPLSSGSSSYPSSSRRNTTTMKSTSRASCEISYDADADAANDGDNFIEEDGGGVVLVNDSHHLHHHSRHRTDSLDNVDEVSVMSDLSGM